MSGMTQIERCGFTGKQRWPTRTAARGALAAWARVKGSRKVHGPCAFCEGFHLSKGQRGRPGKAR